MRNQIAASQQQLNSASQAYINSPTNNALKAAKSDKFRGRNVRSWPKSLRNIFSSQIVMPNDRKTLRCKLSKQGWATVVGTTLITAINLV